MYTVKSNAFFGAETQTEAVGEYDGILAKAVSLFQRGQVREVWITNDLTGRVVWQNGREVVQPTSAKLSGAELYKALTDAVQNERRKADLAGYFAGERGPKEEYEQAQARTNSLINQLLMQD